MLWLFEKLIENQNETIKICMIFGFKLPFPVFIFINTTDGSYDSQRNYLHMKIIKW